MTHIVSRAETHAADVIQAWTARGLINAGITFKAFLASIPDRGSAVTRTDLRDIAAIAEKVIGHIDARIDRQGDSHEIQLEFASLIYRIRARIEELTRWGRHLPA
jgi:hypothetical protein